MFRHVYRESKRDLLNSNTSAVMDSTKLFIYSYRFSFIDFLIYRDSQTFENRTGRWVGRFPFLATISSVEPSIDPFFHII